MTSACLQVDLVPGPHALGDAREAAEWVSYANDPDHRERRSHGAAEPYNIKLWQLGNETSYGNATFKKDESITKHFELGTWRNDRVQLGGQPHDGIGLKPNGK